MNEGQQRKAEGIARAQANPSAAPWRAVAMRHLRELALTGEPFTSEDVTARAGQPPTPNSVGALMNTASRQGWIVRVGFGQAERANQHAALISEWRGVPVEVPNPDSISPVRRGPLCSCGKGEIGHTTTHESTDTPGIVRIVREGKTDQYMNVREVEQRAIDAAAQAKRAQTQAEYEKTPRHSPQGLLRMGKVGIGIGRFCPRCEGTGGTIRDACTRCMGEGVVT